jgi:glycerol-3-phosphate dehydrogenase
MKERSETNQRLKSTDYDLVVIGGGITGCGVARDAARRGLKVAVIEARDVAFGTSSRSSKLIHGGLRYLEQREIGLVWEAVNERRILRKIAPHLVNQQGFLFPIFTTSPLKLWFLKAGLWVYEALVLFRVHKIHSSFSAKKLATLEPLLTTEGLKGSPLYWDCTTDDARLTLETALDAKANGAEVATYRKVVGFVRKGGDADGAIEGVEVKDSFSEERFVVKGRCIVNATGPWSDRTRAIFGLQGQKLRPTKGVHVVVDFERLPVRYAVVLHHPDDGRILFAVPWGDRTYIGTTDTDFDGNPAEVAATGEDVDYLLRSCTRFFPDAQLTRDDIIATWAGLRPLVSTGAEKESDVSREHEIFEEHEGLLTIAGGKITTYRRMSKEVVDRCLNVLERRGGLPPLHDANTHTSPLPGAVGWSASDDHVGMAKKAEEAAGGSIGADTAQFLVNHYGACGLEIAKRLANDPAGSERLASDRPEVLAVVDWAVEREFATTLSDVMIRRTQIFFKDRSQGLDAAEKIATRMAQLLGWDAQRTERELADYRQEVALSRSWQSDSVEAK